MSENLAGWIPPRWDARAPVPCTKGMLVKWLQSWTVVPFDEETHIGEIARLLEAAYEAPIPITEAGARWPATWDIWAYVVRHEKRIRGGQQALDLGIGNG